MRSEEKTFCSTARTFQIAKLNVVTSVFRVPITSTYIEFFKMSTTIYYIRKHLSDSHHVCFALYVYGKFEPLREKTSDWVSDQVRHGPVCTVTEER